MGKNVLKAQYFMQSNEGDSTDATLGAVGWDYKLSKRTTAYLAYAVTSNDENVFNAVNSGGHGDKYTTGANGTDPSGFSVGMIHNF
mgnify:CR=1 FL=1